MPYQSAYDALPVDEKILCDEQLRYLQRTLPVYRGNILFRGFNMSRSQELGVSESTISQNVAGRSKNPRIIKYLYDWTRSALGEANFPKETAHAINDKLSTPSADDQLRMRSREAGQLEKEALVLLSEMRSIAEKLNRRMREIRAIWETVDEHISWDWIQNHMDEANTDLFHLIGYGRQELRLKFSPKQWATIQDLLSMSPEVTDENDFRMLVLEGKGVIHESMREWQMGQIFREAEKAAQG